MNTPVKIPALMATLQKHAKYLTGEEDLTTHSGRVAGLCNERVTGVDPIDFAELLWTQYDGAALLTSEPGG